MFEVQKDFLQIELFELVKQEVETIAMQLRIHPLDLVHLTSHLFTYLFHLYDL